LAELESCAREREAALQRQATASEARALELQQQLERTQDEQQLLQQQQERQQAQEREQMVREHSAVMGLAEQRVMELESRVMEREAALQAAQMHAAALQERVLESQLQLERVQLGASALDMRSVARALSGGVSTVSYADLAAATSNFASANILGRGGFGPVYRGEWNRQAVAVKKLDQACIFFGCASCCACVCVRLRAILTCFFCGARHRSRVCGRCCGK
jgi:hypothetical protein